MAFLLEQAGGACSTGVGRVSDVVPATVHERVPVFLGSRTEVAALERFVREGAETAGPGARRPAYF